MSKQRPGSLRKCGLPHGRAVTSRHNRACRGRTEDGQPGLCAAGPQCKGASEEGGRQEVTGPIVEGPHAHHCSPLRKGERKPAGASFLPLKLLWDQQTNNPHFPSSRLLKFPKSGNWFLTPKGRREEKISQRTRCQGITSLPENARAPIPPHRRPHMGGVSGCSLRQRKTERPPEGPLTSHLSEKY